MADEKKEKRKLWRPVRSEETQKEEELKTAKEAKKQEEPQISAQTDDLKDDERAKDSDESKKRGITKKDVFSYVRIVIIAAAAAFFLMFFMFTNARVPTGSMKDTINENDRLIGLKLAYVAAEPQRGDIVIFKYPDDESTKFVKRVIGLPGETVSFKDGDVYIDGVLLQEDYTKEPHSTEAVNRTEYTVPENSYFMLGDNRRNSKDARWWTNTFVMKDKIEAKVLFRYFDGEKGMIGFSGF